MQKLILLLALATGFTTHAQDPHFSQYYASQMTVNPASAGLFTGDMRVSGLYRQQWPQYGDPFTTATVAFEWKPNGFREGQNTNRLAIGGMLMYDKTPDAVLKSDYAYLTIAYHKALDEEGNNRLGIGFMAGYNQRTMDPSHLTFGNQFASGGFTRGMGESISEQKNASFDLHTGLMYSYEDESKLIYAGVSGYHLLQPKDYFVSENNLLNKTPRRININAGFNIAGENVQWAGSALLMRQQGIHEITIGGAVGFPFAENDGLLYLGSWYRFREAFIPTVNLQWKNMNVGLSYDTYIGSNQTVVKPQSFELSLSARIAPYHDYKTGCYAF